MNKIIEIFGCSTLNQTQPDWDSLVKKQFCPFRNQKCTKVRKSTPQISLGTCTVTHGKNQNPIIICPFRFLERGQVFTDAIHLLTLHEPGNELHIVPEVTIPGGSVDYFLVSVRRGKVKDFVGIELQTVDTTGTLWTDRQKFLQVQGLNVNPSDVESNKPSGMNWKMTAKTILVQLHHKVETFEGLGKHLLLVVQDQLLDYMRREFRFEHIQSARLGDAMQIHTYSPSQTIDGSFRIELQERFSTDTEGIASALGLNVSPRLELEQIIRLLEAKISDRTLLQVT